MNQLLKFAQQVDRDIALRAVLEKIKSGTSTVGDILALPEPQQMEAWRASFNAAFVPETDGEPRGFNEELYDNGLRTGGHEPWESGE